MTITGHLPAVEVSAALHAADVAAFPFTAGATTKSGALLSAFAHGLPTLVTAADPPDPELVDGATVVVADRVRDADALVGPLARLLDDPALRPAWRRAAAAWPWTAPGRGSPPPTRSCTPPCGRPNMPPRRADLLATICSLSICSAASATW